MSEVKEHSVIYLAPACHEEHMQREWCQDDVWAPCEECGSKNTSVRYNLGADFDRVTAERDAALGREAALREDLEGAEADIETIADHNIHLQQRLTAADERADVLEGLLRTSLVAMSRIYSAGRDFIIGAGSDCDSVELMMENDPTAREIRAALKPAEGGGDD